MSITWGRNRFHFQMEKSRTNLKTSLWHFSNNFSLMTILYVCTSVRLYVHHVANTILVVFNPTEFSSLRLILWILTTVSMKGILVSINIRNLSIINQVRLLSKVPCDFCLPLFPFTRYWRWKLHSILFSDLQNYLRLHFVSNQSYNIQRFISHKIISPILYI